MQWLAELSVRRPVLASVLVLSFVVVGVFSYFKLGVDLFPKVDFPMVTVTTRQTGAAPEEIETEITDRIERAVNTIAGIEELRSVSSEGVSQVFIQFVLEKSSDVAAQEVRDKVNQILPDLPQDIDQPVVEKLDPDSAPVLYVALSGSQPIREISEVADKSLRREIESLPGVGQVSLVGSRLRQVNLWLDPARLRAYTLTAAEVSRAVANQNLQLPGGSLGQGSRELTVRLKGRVNSVPELDSLVVASRGPAQITLANVGRAEDGMEEAETAGSVEGKTAVILAVRRQSGTNTVAVVKEVVDRLNALKPRLPAGYGMEIVRDQSVYIEDSVRTVQEHLIVGAILAALVVLLFLRNWRSTLIAAIAIPASILSAFALMYAMGFTLNILTLLALTLAVGIVIDDAIVVLENIYRFVEEKKLSPYQAAIEGTREIGLAVLATTLSLVAVFLPVAFMGGIVGRFMYSFGLTMAFSILVSLLVAFTLTPMLCSRWLTVDAGRASKESAFFRLLDTGYERGLRWAMAHRWIVVLASMVALASIGPVFVVVGKDFLPKNDESQFEVVFRAPEGTTLEQTELIATRIGREIKQLPGVAYTVVLVGDDARRTANKGEGVRQADRHRVAEGHPIRDYDQIRSAILPRFAAEKLRTSVSQVAAISGGGMENKEVAFFVSGPDLGKLAEVSKRLTAALARVPAPWISTPASCWASRNCR